MRPTTIGAPSRGSRAARLPPPSMSNHSRDNTAKHCRATFTSLDAHLRIPRTFPDTPAFFFAALFIYVYKRRRDERRAILSLPLPLRPSLSISRVAHGIVLRRGLGAFFHVSFFGGRGGRWYVGKSARDGQREPEEVRKRVGERAATPSPPLFVGPPAPGTSIATTRGMLATTARQDAPRKSLRPLASVSLPTSRPL